VLIRGIKLSFVPGLEMEFTDRGRAIEQVLEWSEKSTWYPVVVFGPEGCGKTSWLKQAAEVLRRRGFEVIYVDPIHREFAAHTDVEEVVSRLSEAVADVTGYTPMRLADLAVYLAKQLLKRWRKRRITVLVDDIFQAIGVNRAEVYVKMLLNMIEHPPEPYERIVVIATTSEGVSRTRIGRHRWADVEPMWNMPKEGFKELYERIPGPKPSLEDIWRLTGGNPDMFRRLYQSSWGGRARNREDY
jgi:energy-coupling factor transporter ATP-binding protein EcfA2